jgi:small subunit ribosomal protein S2
MLDTNSNPDIVDYGIPANDDASKSISIIMKTLADTFIESSANVRARKDDTESKHDDSKKIVRKKVVKKEFTDNTEE